MVSWQLVIIVAIVAITVITLRGIVMYENIICFKHPMENMTKTIKSVAKAKESKGKKNG